MEQIANNSFTNLFHVLLQMIAVVGWFVFIVKLEDKRSYLCRALYISLNVLSGLMIYTLLKELIDHKFDLDWNLQTWYPINLGLIIVMFLMIDKIEELKDEIDEKGDNKNT